MEFLLLWADNLDDAMGAARHLAPKVIGFLIAVALFTATGLALVFAPHATLAASAVVLSASLIEIVRRRRTSHAETHIWRRPYFVGRNGHTQFTSAPTLRVWIHTLPLPLKRHTKPSPEKKSDL